MLCAMIKSLVSFFKWTFRNSIVCETIYQVFFFNYVYIYLNLNINFR